MSNDSPIHDDLKAQSETPIYREVEKPEPILGPITGEIEHVKSPSKKPQPKVIAATGGSVVGVALTTVLVYVIETAGKFDIPVAVEGAGAILITAAITFASGYVKKN